MNWTSRMRLSFGMALFFAMPLVAEEPWTTYRGNPQRTANTDSKVGPSSPKVLWFYKSQDHFVASPVPTKDQILFSGLGAFNRPMFFSLPQAGQANIKPTWDKSSYLKLPSVSSPAIIDGKLIFGDGMHQTDGAILHCIPASGGLPLWQLKVPGELVHLEGSPTISGKRVYMGAGAAGVLCVEWDKATLDGKEYDLSSVQKMQEAKWKELRAKYQEDKKKDPDFAVEPQEDSLLPFAPQIVWQQGKTKWHVDAPVNVIGDKVLVCTAFLDKEKVGDRSIYCLKSDTGETVWQTPLILNPWGGASVFGDTVIVSTSSIGYDPKSLKGAKGEVIALSLKDGKEKWKKEFPGGVLGCVAISNGLAIFCCTDGKVRALTLKDGERRLLYDVKSPLFAPPSVVGDTVYVGDLKGIIHAIDLKSGTASWQLDLGAEPVKSPGMIYGGIVVHDGKLFVATCNLEGPFARQGTVVVCIGNK